MRDPERRRGFSRDGGRGLLIVFSSVCLGVVSFLSPAAADGAQYPKVYSTDASAQFLVIPAPNDDTPTGQLVDTQVVSTAVSGTRLQFGVPRPPGAGARVAGGIAVGSDAGSITMEPVAVTGRDQVTTGTLHPVEIIDARGTAAGWDLTGQVSDFASPTGVILATNLGWRPSARVTSGDLPAVPGQTSSVIIGPVATPGAGLGVPRTLCRAEVGSSAGSFSCGGGLDLGVPGALRPGQYVAVLTLTLI